MFVGAIAAIARFWLAPSISQLGGCEFPVGALSVNLTGSFVLGLLTGLGSAGNLLLTTGTVSIGSYTTFSTRMLETCRLAEPADERSTVVNAIGSRLPGFGAEPVGRTVGLHL